MNPPLRFLCAARALHAFLFIAAGVSAAETKRSFDLPAADATISLKAFTDQSGQQIVYPAAAVRGIITRAVKGDHTPREALEKMVEGTPLIAAQTKSGVLSIKKAASVAEAQKNVASRLAGDRAASEAEDGVVQLETFEVMGTKSLNMDIRRTRDDAQPYIVFERETIQRSGATNLEDFLMRRLTMNTTTFANSQLTGTLGNTSSINLRGLGAAQTLILIDGRRAGNPVVRGSQQQADINGIPLAAVERIEVLPSTASGIYGGSATGGVINIILRRDYAGAEIGVTYENTFSTDTAIRRVDFSAGFTLEGGKTSVLLAGSWSDRNDLWQQDRDLAARGIAAVLSNNPAFILTGANPPLGSTTNIRSVSGANLTLRATGQSLGSYFTHVPFGYAGPASDNGSGLLANTGKYNYALANAAHIPGGKLSLTAPPETTAFTATVRRKFTAKLEAFVDFGYADNQSAFWSNATSGTPGFTLAANAAGNPFNEAIRITAPIAQTDAPQFNRSTERRATGGVIADLPGGWKAEADYSWNRSRRSDYRIGGADLTATGVAVSAGTLNLFRDPARFPFDVTPYLTVPASYTEPSNAVFRTITARAGGPIWELPAGPVVVSTLLEHRSESFEELRGFSGTLGLILYPETSQRIRSAYVEAQVPLFSAANALPGVRELHLQVAGRYDDYRLDGANPAVVGNVPFNRASSGVDSTNPTVGLRYGPLEGLMLRASWGTGFLPPSGVQLAPTIQPSVATTNVVDPRRGNSAASPLISLTGGNPNLKPEHSESYSSGVILTPKFLPGVRLSVDYTNIKKRDNITTLSPQTIVTNEAVLPHRLVRGPVPPGDLFGAGPLVSIDISSINLSRLRSESVDVALDWEMKSRFGTWLWQFGGTRRLRHESQVITGQPFVDSLGTNSANTKLKLTAGLTWRFRSWTAGWNANYFDDYPVNAAVVLNQGNGGRVKNQQYHDVFVAHRWGATSTGEGALARAVSRVTRQLELQIGVKNVFDEAPPYDTGQSPRYYSLFGDPRGAVYYVTIKKAF